jgi:iron complex transport system substrate-binding protein
MEAESSTHIRRTIEDLPILASFPGFEQLACVRSNRVYVVDGNAYFSRPGPRLVDSLEILSHILHPSLHHFPDNVQPIHKVTSGELYI